MSSEDNSRSGKEFTYKQAGVDIEAGDRHVESIKEMVSSTHNESVLAEIGGFGGLFKPRFEGMRDPVLVSSVDGVGTKLLVAFRCERYDTVGQDLVNHCVNDIAVSGAEPLFFLDYFSTGKLEEEVGYEVVRGFATACRQNGVALVGGETAEMPDLYDEGEFDLAGSIVGMVDRPHILDGSEVQQGDVVIGIPSNGIHTNGYTLARKVLFQSHEVEDQIDELGQSLGDELLRIHRSYLPLIRRTKKMDGVRGFAHITGGGIRNNTRRILDESHTLKVDWQSWERPPIFEMIRREGNVPEDDMRQTFNLGIGLTMVVDHDHSSDLLEEARTYDQRSCIIGEIQ